MDYFFQLNTKHWISLQRAQYLFNGLSRRTTFLLDRYLKNICGMRDDEIPEIKRNIEKADKAVDYMGAVEKIDTNKQKVESEVRSRWEGTTPQGRELIRKKLWEIKREMELKAGVFPPGVALPEVEQPEDDSEPPPLPPITLAHPP